MHALREACTAHNTVLILDEIQSGYGRSGKFFATSITAQKPDIITVAKGTAMVSRWQAYLSADDHPRLLDSWHYFRWQPPGM